METIRSEKKEYLNTTTHAVSIKEALNFPGVGLTVSADCDVVIVKGELDAEVDKEYDLHATALRSKGMPSVVGDTIIVARGMAAVRMGGVCTMMSVVQQAAEAFTSVVRSWSPARLSEEVQNMEELLPIMARTVAVFDDAPLMDVRVAWGDSLVAMSVDFLSCSTGVWLPTSKCAPVGRGPEL